MGTCLVILLLHCWCANSPKCIYNIGAVTAQAKYYHLSLFFNKHLCGATHKYSRFPCISLFCKCQELCKRCVNSINKIIKKRKIMKIINSRMFSMLVPNLLVVAGGFYIYWYFYSATYPCIQ